MKLSKKLFLSFGVLIAIMVISSTTVWFKVSTETVRALEAKGDDLPGKILYNEPSLKMYHLMCKVQQTMLHT